MEFVEAVSKRRSEYALDAQGVDTDAVLSTIEGIAGAVPSAFNVQSARAVFLAGDGHRRFWAIVEDVLRERSRDPERFERTREKISGFSAAAGTVLFYEIDRKTHELIDKHPTYRDLFPNWACQHPALQSDCGFQGGRGVLHPGRIQARGADGVRKDRGSCGTEGQAVRGRHHLRRSAKE